MKKILTLLAIVIAGAGCSKFDDSAIWESIGELDHRVNQLEEICNHMNTNISSLQAIVQALESHDYIKNVVSLPNDNGYIISFASGKDITIYHGKDGENGKDGATPLISIKQDTDGIYYWTVNGEWLLVDGQKVNATGKDGADGQDGDNGTDGITPEFKIENGYWFISYDKGTSWTQLGKATGNDGQDGADGSSGQDGITPDFKIDNGYWYVSYDKGSTWTQIGKATGENGQDGNDGITPKFKIENGYWYISYDNELTWELVGKATGEDGQDGTNSACIFKSVSFSNGFMHLTLNNAEETIISLPFANENYDVLDIHIEEEGTLMEHLTDEQAQTLSSLKVTGYVNITDIRDINVRMPFLKYLDLSEAKYMSTYTYFELNPLRLNLPNRSLNTFISPRNIIYGQEPMTPQIININDCINLKKLVITSPEPESPGVVAGEKIQSALWGNRLDSLIFTTGVNTINYELNIAKVVVLPETTEQVNFSKGGGYSVKPAEVLICKALTPPQMQATSYSLKIFKTATLYVPSESVELYKTAEGWKEFETIKEIGQE